MEKTIDVSKDELLKKYMFKKLPSGNSGDELFVTLDYNVFKIINNGASLEEHYNFFVNQTSDVFVFPKQLVMYDGMFLGYVMDYAPGVTLKDVNREISIADVIGILKIIESAILKDITDKGIAINDMHIENIILGDDKSIKVIDTDFYDIYFKEKDLKRMRQLHEKNITEYNNEILAFIFLRSKGLYEIEDYLPIEVLSLIRKVENGRIYASDFLEQFVSVLNNNYNKYHTTISDIDETLAKTRKNVNM